MVDSNRLFGSDATRRQERHPLVKHRGTDHGAFHSQEAECLLLERQYITPVITVKPASITIKRQMRAGRITDRPVKYRCRKGDQVRDH